MCAVPVLITNSTCSIAGQLATGISVTLTIGIHHVGAIPHQAADIGVACTEAHLSRRCSLFSVGEYEARVAGRRLAMARLHVFWETSDIGHEHARLSRNVRAHIPRIARGAQGGAR